MRQTRALAADSRSREGSVELTAAIREYLLYGTGQTHEERMRMKYDLGPVRRYPQNMDEIWEEHRATLIEEFKAEKGHGMPEGWWKYDCPERRKVVSGNKFLIFHSDWDAELPGNEGLPNSFRDDPDMHPNPPIFESRESYLRRLEIW